MVAWVAATEQQKYGVGEYCFEWTESEKIDFLRALPCPCMSSSIVLSSHHSNTGVYSHLSSIVACTEY